MPFRLRQLGRLAVVLDRPLRSWYFSMSIVRWFATNREELMCATFRQVHGKIIKTYSVENRKINLFCVGIAHQ